MSIAFLEGAEYAFATEETVTTIDYATRYSHEEIEKSLNQLFSTVGFGYQTVKPFIFDMRDDLVGTITELRSTIATQQDTIDDLQEQLQRKYGGMWALLEKRSATIDELVADKRAQRERIEELEAAIGNGQLYAEGCKP